MNDPSRDAIALMKLLVVDDDGHRWGDVAEPFQIEDVEAILDLGKAKPSNLCTRPRGGRKTTDTGGMLIAVMLTPGQVPAGSRIYAAAADQDQARLLIDSIREFVARTPELQGALTINRYEVLANRTGVTLEILAADAASAYGLRPAFLVCDEIAQWPTTDRAKEMWRALDTATGKIPGCRTVLLTSAGSPSHWSHTDIRKHALKSPDRWYVHEVPGPLAFVDPNWLFDQKQRLHESVYARLHLNIWTVGEGRLTTEEWLARCITLDGTQAPAKHDYVVSIDLGLVNDRTVLAVCHQERFATDSADPDDVGGVEGRRVVLDYMKVWQGTRLRPVKIADVEKAIVNEVFAYRSSGGRVRVVLDPHELEGTLQSLKRQGIKAEPFTFSTQSNGRLALTLHRLIRDGGLAIPDDKELIAELLDVKLLETSPNVFRLDHESGAHDDRAVALALAAHSLLANPPQGIARMAGTGHGRADDPYRDLRRRYEAKGVVFESGRRVKGQVRDLRLRGRR